MLKHEVFEAATTTQDAAIVMPNHFAGTLDGTNGSRAHHLNQHTGLTVVAFERPGTGTTPKIEPFTVETYLADAGERAKKLQGILDSLGIERAVISHDSGGALDALALAASGQIQVERAIPIEPVAMTPVTNTTQGFKEWAKAGITGKKGSNLAEFRVLEELPTVRPEPSLMRTTRRQLSEFRIYRDIYSSDIARNLLRQLRDDEVPVDLIIAGHSFAIPTSVQEEVKEEFADSSVNVTVYEGADHNFTEPAANFVHVVKKALHAAANR